MDLTSTLALLESNQLVRRDLSSDISYLFKHALTQEMAYASLLKSKRAELHLRVAETIESMPVESIDENAAVLALHFDRAGSVEKAFTYSALAGDVSRRTSSHREAIAFYDRALVLAANLDTPRTLARVRTVYLNRGNTLQVAGDHAAAIENYSAMIAYAKAANDRVMEADGLSHVLTAQAAIGNVPDSEHQLKRALELAQESGDAELIGRAYWNMGLSTRFSDQLAAQQYLERALEYAQKANLAELTAFTLLDLNFVLQLSGQWLRSLECGRLSIQAFRALDNKAMLANALGTHAVTLYGRGENNEARETALECLHLARSIENPWGIGYSAYTLLSIEVDAGNFGQAAEYETLTYESVNLLKVPLFQGLANLWVARSYLELNQLERAGTLAKSGMEQLQAMHVPVWSTFAPGVYARVLLRQGHLDFARELLDPLWQEGADPSDCLWGFYLSGPAIAECALACKRYDFGIKFCNWLLDNYEREQMLHYAAEMHFAAAQLAAALGTADVEIHLVRALELAERAGFKTLLWRVCAALARHLLPRDQERANELKARAKQVIQEIATSIPDPHLRDGFFSREDVNEIVD